MYPEASSKVCHGSFCQLGNSVSLSWVIYYGAFCVYYMLFTNVDEGRITESDAPRVGDTSSLGIWVLIHMVSETVWTNIERL
jgi:hypothetical protein